MATLKQAESIMAIYKSRGKTISFDEAYEWPKAKAWKFISQNYFSFYDAVEKNRRQHE